ncbi:MAG: pseudouridine synthase [Clostridiales bacterium]|nr:MAG: pseudouridine synthase [Clostridiales bacterium]
MRLQKYMAEAGIASRRKCEELIQAGRVKVNGQVAILGACVEPLQDLVEVDGEPLGKSQQKVTVILNKPRGVMCTAQDPQGRPTVGDYVKDLPVRVYNAGRLDYDSEGLLVMTNDGELAYKLTHPRFCMDKTYAAICDGLLTKAQIAALEQGVQLEDGPTHPAKVREVFKLRNGNTAFNITIHEGRNRQVRRMLEAVGHETLALKRVALGPLRLGDLPSGTYRSLTAQEWDELYAWLRSH